MAEPVAGTADERTVEPLHRLRFPNDPSIDAAALSPDGHTVYAAVEHHGVNLGAVIDATFHWWFAAICLIVFAWSSTRATAPFRNPQYAGPSRCRRCGYEAFESAARTGTGVHRCPECGTDLAAQPPRRRQVIPRRARRSAVLMALVASAQAGAWALVPRNATGVISRFGLVSLRLGRWADAFAWTVPPRWIGTETVLVAVDSRIGSWERLFALRGPTHGRFAVTPGGESLLISDQPSVIRLVSLPGGREIARLDLPSNAALPHDGPLLIGTLPETGEVLISYTDAKASLCRLVAWRWAVNRTRTVVETALYRRNGTLGERRFSIVPGHDSSSGGVRYVSYPGIVEATAARDYELRCFDSQGRELRVIRLGRSIAPYARPAFSSDGSMFYLLSSRRGRVHAYRTKDVASGLERSWGTLNSRMPAGDGAAPVVAGDGRLLCIDGFQAMRVRDTATRSWLATLAVPKNLYGLRTSVSPEGRWAVAIAQRDDANRGWLHELVIWRIPQPPQIGGRPTVRRQE